MKTEMLNEIAARVSRTALTHEVVRDALQSKATSLSINIEEAADPSLVAWRFEIFTSPPDFQMEFEEFDGEQMALTIKDELDRSLPNNLSKEEHMEIWEYGFSLKLNGKLIFSQPHE